jgi:hypothetical protein
MRAESSRFGRLGTLGKGDWLPQWWPEGRNGLCVAGGLAAVIALSTGGAGCAAPVLSRDGQLVVSQAGARGASVITAHGIEFIDRADIPRPVIRRSVNEPFHPATGFLLPADGIWRKTSKPVAVEGHGLLVTLRSSDVLIPSWGGEILLRLDAIAPAAAFPRAAPSIRPAERLAIILDGTTAETTALVSAALEDLGGADRVGIIDAGGARGPARPLLPLVPGSHRTLLRAAVEQLVTQAARTPAYLSEAGRDLAGALATARGWVGVANAGDGDPAVRHVLVLSDAVGVARGGTPLARQVQALAAAGARLTAVGAGRLSADALAPLGADVHPGGSLEQREAAIDASIRPPGDVVLEDVSLSISSVPAPARIIETSGGQSALALDKDHFILGDLYAGEARTEVARLTLPTWVPGEPLDLTITATYRDAASGQPQTAEATLHCRYSNDIERIAAARHGDVIAYASALAMVRRLHRAFLGSEIDRIGGLHSMVGLQARSLASLAKTSGDAALGAQAEILSSLLGAIDD